MRGIAGLAIGLVLGAAAVMAASAPPPVILDLGRVFPTPAPTPDPFQKRRMITTLTVQNTPEGTTQVLFEAMDFYREPSTRIDEGGDAEKTRIIASQRYTIGRDSPDMRGLRDRVVREIRALEAELLAYVEVAGPPQERKILAPEYGD